MTRQDLIDELTAMAVRWSATRPLERSEASQTEGTPAYWAVTELDLHARHDWLIGQRESITERLRSDPEWCDPRAAGWWVWGASAWIGQGWGARAGQGGLL